MAGDPTPRSRLTHIGAWKLGATLGRGAYAHVRLATHESGHRAACKILPALHHDPRVRVTWDQTIDAVEAHKEVVLLKALYGAGVKGVVGLESVIEEGGWTYVFLTLYPCSASTYPTPWAPSYLIPFFRRLLIAVHSIHQLNISHEDLKRSNVLVDDSGSPVLVDFGFSHFRPHGEKVKSAGGTLDYSSPEKSADMLYDPKANDVWALGILLLKLLGFPHPYDHGKRDHGSDMVRHNIVHGVLSYDLASFAGGAPPGLDKVIQGMLERDPKYRWTIPQILEHPALKDQYRHRDPKPLKVPASDWMPPAPVHSKIIDDLCFLEHLNSNFALCETPKKIERKLYGAKPCWEKQWASMLHNWSNHAEQDWQDIPKALETPRPRKSVDAQRLKVESRALKQIALSPNIVEVKANIELRPAKQLPKSNATVEPQVKAKSRLYSMKTRDASTKAASAIPVHLQLEQATPSRAGRENEGLGRRTSIVVGSSPMKSPLHSTVGHTRKALAKTLTHIKTSTVDEIKPLKIRPKRTGGLPKYATGGASSAVPSLIDSDEDFGVQSLSDDDGSVKGQATSRLRAKRSGDRAKNKESPSALQMTNLFLDKPAREIARRRSPRLHL